MSYWTDTARVSTHLSPLLPAGGVVRNTEIVFDGYDDVQLPHNNIVPASETLGMIAQQIPSGPVSVTLNGETWTAIGTSGLAPGTVTVASTSFPDGWYAENSDYAINYAEGKLKRIGGTTTIPDGATVRVWFMPYTIFTRDVDYVIDNDAGTVKRVAGTTSIPDGGRVAASYESYTARATSTLIAQAITEAEDKILARLRDDYDSSSTDQGLVTGATELALSIVCDALAASTLGAANDPGADNRARRYMDLAERFEARAAMTLSRFLTQPVRAEAMVRPNRTDPRW
ncbi:hypothetical protein GF324_07935 [bacterium]|nr:hypothetical protein [bacterium]